MRKQVSVRFLVSGILTVAFFVSGGYVYADTELKLEKTILYGGVGDQTVNATYATESSLFLAGTDMASGGKSLALRYAIPPTDTPLENFRWLDEQKGAASVSTTFSDMVAASDGLYFVGHSLATMSGKKKTTQLSGILAKFTSGGFSSGKPTWAIRPGFFPEHKEESLRAVVVDQEHGAPMIYVTGYASNGEDNMTAMLAKYDASGVLLWSKELGDKGKMKKSSGTALTLLNGHVYISGFTSGESKNEKLKFKNLPLHPTLWKFDPAGNRVWSKTAELELFSHDSSDNVTQGIKVDVVGADDHLYLASAKIGNKNSKGNILFLKYNQNGDVVLENAWEAVSKSGELAKYGWGLGIKAGTDRLYVAGFMEHKGSSKDKDMFLLEVDKVYGSVLAAHFYGETGYIENGFGLAATATDVYMVGMKNAISNDKKKPSSDANVALLRYSIMPISTVKIDVASDALNIVLNKEVVEDKSNKKKKKAPVAKEVSVAILSTDDFNAPLNVKMPSLRFGRTGNEASWTGCTTKDMNGDGSNDLLCYFKQTWSPWKEAKPIFEAGDTQGILKGQTNSGSRFVGKDSLTGIDAPAPPSKPEPVPQPEMPLAPAPPLTSGGPSPAQEPQPPPVTPGPEPALPLPSTPSSAPPVVEGPSPPTQPAVQPEVFILEPPLTSGPVPVQEPVQPVLSTPSPEPKPVALQTSEPSVSPAPTSTQIPVTAPTTSEPVLQSGSGTTNTSTPTPTSSSTQTTQTTSPTQKVVFVAQPTVGASQPSQPATSALPASVKPVVSESKPPANLSSVLNTYSSSRPSMTPKVGMFSSQPHPEAEVLASEELTQESQSQLDSRASESGSGSGLAKAYNDLGREAFQSGKLSEAIAYFKEALQLNPAASEIHRDMGLVLVEQGKFEEAMTYLSEALKLNPNDTVAREKLDFISGKLSQAKA